MKNFALVIGMATFMYGSFCFFQMGYNALQMYRISPDEDPLKRAIKIMNILVGDFCLLDKSKKKELAKALLKKDGLPINQKVMNFLSGIGRSEDFDDVMRNYQQLMKDEKMKDNKIIKRHQDAIVKWSETAKTLLARYTSKNQNKCK